VETVRLQLQQLQRLADAEATSQLKALDAKLIDAEMKLVDLRQTGTGQDGVRFGSKLISKLGYLSNGVATSDFKPTAQATEVQTILTTENQSAIRALDALLRTELPVLNRALDAKQLPKVVDRGAAPARIVP
jgi:hypothetical protein